MSVHVLPFAVASVAGSANWSRMGFAPAVLDVPMRSCADDAVEAVVGNVMGMDM